MAIPVDLRIKKTYRALFDAFTELLEEHRFEDLTVAMLCDRAMIRRTTFYKHFRDKNDYFAFYIDELMSGLPQKQPDEAGAVSAEDVRALRHAILDDAMDLILAHEQLMDNILASSMSGMLTNVICDRIARSIRERVMNVLAEDALAPVSLETTSEFVAGGIIRLFTIWWESGHDRSCGCAPAPERPWWACSGTCRRRPACGRYRALGRHAWRASAPGCPRAA